MNDMIITITWGILSRNKQKHCGAFMWVNNTFIAPINLQTLVVSYYQTRTVYMYEDVIWAAVRGKLKCRFSLPVVLLWVVTILTLLTYNIWAERSKSGYTRSFFPLFNSQSVNNIYVTTDCLYRHSNRSLVLRLALPGSYIQMLHLVLLSQEFMLHSPNRLLRIDIGVYSLSGVLWLSR